MLTKKIRIFHGSIIFRVFSSNADIGFAIRVFHSVCQFAYFTSVRIRVFAPGFCKQSFGSPQGCGWHSYFSLLSATSSEALTFKFAWVGVPPPGCNCFPQPDVSPNNNPGVDAAINHIARQLVETSTDPEMTGFCYTTSVSANCIGAVEIGDQVSISSTTLIADWPEKTILAFNKFHIIKWSSF